MLHLLLIWLINTVALIGVAYLMPSISISSFGSALVAALILGLLNAVIRPILILLTLPATLVTLGLFIFVINGLLFWFAGSFKSAEGIFGVFTADRLGFNVAWLCAIYLTFQLLSIPFSLPSGINRFMGVVDGMASLVPLAVVLIVVFGKTQLIGTWERWETAGLLIFVTMVDLFGGYMFNIALSRRTMDVGQTPI